MFTIWIIAAIVVFAVSLVIAVISVEKDKKLEALQEDVSERGDAMFLDKEEEAPKLGHGATRQEIEPGESRELLDDTQHSHATIVGSDTVGAGHVSTNQPAVHSGPAVAEGFESAAAVKSEDEEDEIIPRYLEEEMNDKEQSKKLAGEIDL